MKCRATCSSHDSCPGPEQHVLLLALESQGEKVLVSSQAHSRFPRSYIDQGSYGKLESQIHDFHIYTVGQVAMKLRQVAVCNSEQNIVADLFISNIRIAVQVHDFLNKKSKRESLKHIAVKQRSVHQMVRKKLFLNHLLQFYR